MTQLEPCPNCRRHVKVSETACPFCASALSFADLAPRIGPRARLGRAAVFAFGVVAMAQACGDDDTKGPPKDAAILPHDTAPPDVARDAPGDGGVDADIDAGGLPIYAAAPTMDGDAGTTSKS